MDKGDNIYDVEDMQMAINAGCRSRDKEIKKLKDASEWVNRPSPQFVVGIPEDVSKDGGINEFR